MFLNLIGQVGHWWATGALVLAEGAAKGAKAPKGDAANSLLLSPLLPFLVIGVLFYFLMIRPERRKRSELTEMLANLQRKDRVVTIGGIFGTVLSVNEAKNEVTISVDDNNNTKLRMQRNAIARVVDGESKSEK